MAITNVRIGADPEVFFVEARTEKPRSAEGMLGGDKNHPVRMKDLPDGFFVQEDNVTAEFNIPPATRAEEFASSIFKSIKYISKIARKNGCKIAFKPELDFPKEQLQTKHCMTFGCNPDLNIWTLKENPTPKAPETMRTAAGHIHIGWEQPNYDDVLRVGRMFDLFVTVPSILVTEPNRRRQLYGRAGACRLKNYGIECRSLDNFWLEKRAYCLRVFFNTQRIMDNINTLPAGMIDDLLEDYSPLIQEAINDHRKDVAAFLVNKFNVTPFE